MMIERGGVVVITAMGSGGGKDLVTRRVAKEFPGSIVAVNFTSRPKRDHETHGVDYNFISQQEFEARKSEMWESLLYGNGSYGSPRAAIEESLNGKLVLIRADPTLAANVEERLRVGYKEDPARGQALLDRLIVITLLATFEEMRGRLQDDPRRLARLPGDEVIWNENRQKLESGGRYFLVDNHDGQEQKAIDQVVKIVSSFDP